jgi:hypothetical protein
VVVGLQEMVKLNALSVFQGKDRARILKWEKMLKECIDEQFRNEDPEEQLQWVTAKCMVGCFIGLFVKRKILNDRFKDFKTDKIKTGMGGSTGNKGAVILRF